MAAGRLPENLLPVVIAGGGIGGLTAAIALARHGIASHVHERRESFSEDGAGIQIGPNGTRILRDLGVADALLPNISAPESIVVHDGQTGRTITELPLGSWIAERHGSPYWTVQRSHLHAALLKTARGVPLITLTTGSAITAFETSADRVAAIDAGGSRHSALALIAADGLWSALRPAIASPGAPRPVGKSAYRTLISSDNLPAGVKTNSVHVWLSPGSHAVHYPVSAGREIAVVVIVNDAQSVQNWSTPAPRGTLLNLTRDFAHELKTLIASAEAWRMWSLHTLPPVARWSNGRTTLLGDAAHPILPFLAQGGVLALEDSVVLARLMSAYPTNIPQALRLYQSARMIRTARVAASSTSNGRAYQLRGATAAARNGLLKSIPGAIVMRRYDWLYGWRDAS